jgi:hypothetical protein
MSAKGILHGETDGDAVGKAVKWTKSHTSQIAIYIWSLEQGLGRLTLILQAIYYFPSTLQHYGKRTARRNKGRL